MHFLNAGEGPVFWRKFGRLFLKKIMENFVFPYFTEQQKWIITQRYEGASYSTICQNWPFKEIDDTIKGGTSTWVLTLMEKWSQMMMCLMKSILDRQWSTRILFKERNRIICWSYWKYCCYWRKWSKIIISISKIRRWWWTSTKNVFLIFSNLIRSDSRKKILFFLHKKHISIINIHLQI